jgi:hypothetical protein
MEQSKRLINEIRMIEERREAQTQEMLRESDVTVKMLVENNGINPEDVQDEDLSSERVATYYLQA